MSNKPMQEVLNWLDLEVKSLKNEIDSRNQTIEKLEKLILGLKEYNSLEEYKEKYENMLNEYEKEKDRLVKLHSHYRQIEADRQELKTKVDGWENWFSSNRQIFDKLFSSAPPAEFFTPEKKPEDTKPINIKRRKLKRK